MTGDLPPHHLVAISGMGMGEAWRRTFEQVGEGRLCVIVHAEKAPLLDRPEEILEEREPTDLFRIEGESGAA